MTSAAGTSGTAAPPVRLPQAWWVFLLGGAALVIAYHWVPRGTATTVYYVAVGALGVGAMALGIHLRRPVRRAPWLVLLASQVLWVLGDAVGGVLAAVSSTDYFPTVADAFYLVAYPVLAVALLMLTRGRRPRRDLEGLLDALTVLIGLALLTMVVIGSPAPVTGGHPVLALVVSGAYPQLDILIITILVALITTPGSRTPALKLLVVALSLVVTADVGATALDKMTFDSTGALDHLWLASYVLLGAALLHPSLYELSIPVRAEQGQLRRSRVAATILVMLVPPGVLVGEHLRHRPISVWPIALASAAMFGLVVLRMTIVVRQIAAAQAEREQAQAALAYQASHDSLTGLPNRAQGLELVSASLARAQRDGALVGLLFVDLDGFKGVNDSYGHRAGDEVLQAVAARMRAVLREGDMVGRLGGDEFVVLLEPLVETGSAVTVAERLIGEVSAAVTLSHGHPVRVGASVGVAISQDGGTDAETLLNEADTAAYRAKNLGRGRVEVFGDALRRELQERSDLERALRRALAEDALTLRYDPVVEVGDGTVLGYQAVLDWDRPGVGPVTGEQLRAVAELSDLAFDLDTWVLGQATRQLAVWNGLSATRLGLGVYVSARHLARVRVLDDVRRAVEESAIAPGQLTVEITDTTFIDDPVGFGNLDRIRELGVRVGLQDFGTGYSSVRRLQRLPIDVVKLDGGFLDWRSPSGAGLLQLMVQGVQNFGLPLVVTGVTDDEHRAMLSGLGCEVMEGSCFGGPFTAAEVAERIARMSPLPS